MAIVEFKRIDITAHISIKKEIIGYLQEIGCVEIIASEEADENLEYGESKLETHIQASRNTMQDIENAIRILEPYVPAEPFLKRIQNEPETVAESDYQNIVKDRLRIYKRIEECNALHEKRLQIEKQIEKALREKEDIIPWKELEVPLDSLNAFTHVETALGRIPAVEADEFQNGYRDITAYTACSKVYTDTEYVYMCIIFHKKHAEEIQQFLSDSQFERLSPPETEASARELFRTYADTISSCKREKAEIEKKLKDLSADLSQIKAIYDHSRTIYEGISAGRYCGNTASVFRLRGWIPSESADMVLHDLEEMGPVQANAFTPENSDSKPPVLLKNRTGVKPFELVTRLYGLPSYGSLDPTGYLAPFFFLFFGLCLSDAAYGILLILFTAVCIKKLKLKGDLYTLLFLCGIGTVIGGAITGSWFGVNVCRLPEDHWASFLGIFALLDPIGTKPEPFFGLMLEGTMAFFYLSIFLGYIQICFATFLSFKEHIRNRRYIEGICEDGAWLTIYIGILMLACSAESMPGLASYGWTVIRTPSLYILLVGLIFRLILFPLLTAIYEKRRTTLLRVAGLYALSTVKVLDKSKDLLGNVLSYCRLMALGMATGIIGTVINQLAFQVKAIPWVGIIFMVILLCGGHMFNLLINLLGAFVHTARLQYVEFFPYFYEGGGAPFRPLAVKNKYIRIE
ncbi:V-type ATP synthase subunit I [Planctomycetota bacterium]